jgi:hypothetical protein
MHYLFAEFKANSILQISKRFLFEEKKSASCNPAAGLCRRAADDRRVPPTGR